MKRKSMYKTISKGLLIFGIISGLSLFSGIASAVGQITVTTNDTVVETGELFSAIVALNGDGRYDVYVGITGGVFGGNFSVFNAAGGFVPWLSAEGPPPKLRDNVDLGSLSVKDKIIRLLPRISLKGYTGNYAIYAVLSTPGQFQQQLQDGTLIIDGPLNITVKGDTQ